MVMGRTNAQAAFPPVYMNSLPIFKKQSIMSKYFVNCCDTMAGRFKSR
jgi:hypothetical protein